MSKNSEILGKCTRGNKRIFDSNIHGGFRNLLRMSNDAPFRIAIALGTVLSYFTVVIDFTAQILSNVGYRHRMQAMEEGSNRACIFAIDAIFLVDVLIALTRRANKLETRNIVIIILEIFSLIPLDGFYVLYGGDNVKKYYSFRLRYVLRFARYFTSETKIDRFNLVVDIAKYMIFISVFCVTISCCKMLYICGMGMGYPNFNCTHLEYYDFARSYSSMLGTTTGVDLRIDHTIQTEYDPFYNLCAYIAVTYMTANIICTHIEALAAKFEYATMTNNILTWMKKVKLKCKDNWGDDEVVFEICVKKFMQTYSYYWKSKSHRYENNGYAIATMPDVKITDIKLDTAWNMFKHSVLFKNQGVNFLRRLSMFTKYEVLYEGMLVFQKGIPKGKLIYIVAGVVDVLSETDLVTPIISFSGGTCLGESSLFLSAPSNTTVVCRTYCEVITLERKNFIKMKNSFPKMFATLEKDMQGRLENARLYKRIEELHLKLGKISMKKADLSLRYIKKIQRKWINTKFEKNNYQNCFEIGDLKESDNLDKCVMCTKYQSLYVINEVDFGTFDHFMKTGTFFRLNPDSVILGTWNFFLNAHIIAYCVIYPVLASLYNFNTYTSLLVYITMLWQFDFMLFAFKGIRQKGIPRTDFDFILNRNIQTLDFWFDFIACCPVDVLTLLVRGSDLSQAEHKLLEMNRLLKCYKLISYLSTKQFSSTLKLLYISYMAMVLTFISIILTGYYIITLSFYFKYLTVNSFTYHISFVIQFFFSTSLLNFKVTRDCDFLAFIISQYGMFLWKLITLSFIVASFSLHYLPKIEFENFVDDVKKAVALNNFSSDMKRKILKHLTVLHSTEYQHLRKREVIKFTGKHIYKRIMTLEYGNFLNNWDFFKDLPQHIIRDLQDIVQVLIIPKHEFLAYAGGRATDIYLIMEGMCGYVAGHGEFSYIISKIHSGQALLLLEVLCGVNVVHNVLTLTDCTLLSINEDALRRKLVKYPTFYFDVKNTISKVVSQKRLKDMQQKECNITEETLRIDDTSFVKFDKHSFDYLNGFGSKFWLRHFLLKYTIKPEGKFWIYWEIFNLVIIYMAFILTLPLPRSTFAQLVWFRRILTLPFYIDIYLRHHVIFYNAKKIEISHPWATAVHYWKTTFIIDLTAYFLTTVLRYLQYITTNSILIRQYFLKLYIFLQLYRFYGVRKFFREKYFKENKFLHLSVLLASFPLIADFLTFTVVLAWCDLDYNNSKIHCGTEYDGDFLKLYTFVLQRTLKAIFAIGVYSVEYSTDLVWKLAFVGVCGFFFYIYIISQFIGSVLFRNTDLTTFQIKMERLIKFMSISKIDKNLKDEIIKHYEYLWILKEGKTLQKTFESFTKTYYEEIMYDLYGSTLQKSIVFKTFPKVILKMFVASSALKQDTFLKNGVIIQVNNIQNKFYFLYKGSVTVLGPDLTILASLGVGSIFGCLDNITYHRCTLTYVAKTHCEVLSMDSKEFHNIINKFPQYYRQYFQLLQNSNMDYIQNIISRNDLDITEKKKILKRSEYQNIIKGNKLTDCLKIIFQVFDPNKNLTVLFIVLCFITFLLEAYQKAVLSTEIQIVGILYVLDILFWTKIYMNFSTAYEDALGFLVKKRKKIALRYIKNYKKFGLYFLSGFPFEIFAAIVLFVDDSKMWTMWSILRINRLFKIIFVFKHILSRGNRLNVNIHLLTAGFLFLSIITLQQISAIFIAITNQENLTGINLYMQAIYKQIYYMSQGIYRPKIATHATTMIFPLINSGVIIITRIAVIYLTAECVAGYQMILYSPYKFQNYINSLKKDIASKGTSDCLWRQILHYFIRLNKIGRKVQFPSFMRAAPFYLREGIMHSMFGFHLIQHPVFGKCHVDLIRQLSSNLRTDYFFPGDFITYLGDIDGKMYFIHEGEVDCLTDDTLDYETVIARYKSGDSFGFKQLIQYNIGHQYSYKVIKETMILVMKRDKILHLFDFFPASKYIIYNFDQFATSNDHFNFATK